MAAAVGRAAVGDIEGAGCADPLTIGVSDGSDLSTAELLRQLGAALGRPARLVPVPTALLRAAARLAGKRHIAQRLLGSLQVDGSKARDLLDWTPPLSTAEGLHLNRAYARIKDPKLRKRLVELVVQIAEGQSGAAEGPISESSG